MSDPAQNAHLIAWTDFLEHSREAASQTKDSRMQLLAGANVGLAGYNTYDAIKTGQGTTMFGKDNQMPVVNEKGETVCEMDFEWTLKLKA